QEAEHAGGAERPDGLGPSHDRLEELLLRELDLLADEGPGVGRDRLHELQRRLLIDRGRFLLGLAGLLHVTHLLSDSYLGRRPAARTAPPRSPAPPAPPASPAGGAPRCRPRSPGGSEGRGATASSRARR